jgi:hypothetical protein
MAGFNWKVFDYASDMKAFAVTAAVTTVIAIIYDQNGKFHLFYT